MTLFRRTVVTLLLLPLVLAACAPNRQAGPKNVSPEPHPHPTPGSSLLGTGDSGGGSGIDNQVLESFVTEVTSLSEWKKYIEPIAINIDRAKRTWENQNVFIALTKSKRWFIAPITLSNIPKDRLGLGFSQDPLQQIALQTEREIWVDKSIYEKGDEEARALLLLHEVVLGLYTLKFKTGSEVCKALTPKPSQVCEDAEAVEATHGSEPPMVRSKSALGERDYQNIREMTSWLFSHRDRFDLYAYYDRLNELSFDPRLIDPEVLHPGTFQTGRPRPELNWDAKTFVEQLQSAQRLGHFPMFCEYDDHLMAQAKCAFSVATNKDQSRLILSVKKLWLGSETETSEQYEFTIPDKLRVSTRMPDLSYGKGITTGLSLVTFSHVISNPRQDQVVHDLILKFKGENSSEIPLIVSLALEPLKIHKVEMSGHGGLHYSASTPSKRIASPFFSYVRDTLPSEPLFSTTRKACKNPISTDISLIDERFTNGLSHGVACECSHGTLDEQDFAQLSGSVLN